MISDERLKKLIEETRWVAGVEGWYHQICTELLQRREADKQVCEWHYINPAGSPRAGNWHSGCGTLVPWWSEFDCKYCMYCGKRIRFMPEQPEVSNGA